MIQQTDCTFERPWEGQKKKTTHMSHCVSIPQGYYVIHDRNVIETTNTLNSNSTHYIVAIPVMPENLEGSVTTLTDH